MSEYQSASEQQTLAQRYASVRSQIAAHRASRTGQHNLPITTVVVTKYHPVELNVALHELGQRDFGESKHQEASKKVGDPRLADTTWHFVGQLQSNKAKQVASYADVLHSLDRQSLLSVLQNVEREIPLDVFVQVNLGSEAHRGGLEPQELLPFAERVLATPTLNLLGVMGVPPLGEEPRRAFARLRDLSEQLQQLDDAARFISAGMSQDWAEALDQGATHLRIGTAITGFRPNTP